LFDLLKRKKNDIAYLAGHATGNWWTEIRRNLWPRVREATAPSQLHIMSAITSTFDGCYVIIRGYLSCHQDIFNFKGSDKWRALMKRKNYLYIYLLSL